MPVTQLASRLSPRGWLIAGGGLVGAILFVYIFLHMVSQPSYSTLASGLNPAQTGKMTSALDQQGISYQLESNGTALAVQSNQVPQARVALASAGVLGSSHPDLSLFEKQNLGESNFQQQVNYQRALQGQLEETIDNVQGVSGAQVQLVLPSPQAQLFASSQTPSSAAVLLSGTTSLDPGSVRGIAQLVASSVPGLSLSKVTITDGSGRLLWPTAGGEGAEGGETTKQADEQRYDQSMSASLDAMLVQTLGAAKAQVQVYAEMNVNKTTQEALTYGKAGVPLSQSKDIETLAGNGSGTGATGTANIPAYAQTGSGKSNYKHEITSTSLGVNRTVTHSVVAPGEITSQHVSVLVDKSVPAASLPAIREAITNAAGLQTKRGDTLSIAQVAFAKSTVPAAGAASGIIGYAKYALIGLASLLFLFFTTRSLRKREQADIEQEPVWLRELEMPVRLSELERETSAPHAPTPIAAAPTAVLGGGSGGGGDAPARQRVEQLAQENPDRVAQQLRAWMQED
jgi:flagellar M-ring protein FliF